MILADGARLIVTGPRPSSRYRGFGGGGFGFGTPVVSYAPRPMLMYESSLVIMETAKA